MGEGTVQPDEQTIRICAKALVIQMSVCQKDPAGCCLKDQQGAEFIMGPGSCSSGFSSAPSTAPTTAPPSYEGLPSDGGPFGIPPDDFSKYDQ